MLESHAERLAGKIADDVQRRIRILYIVVRHLLALDLPREGQRIRLRLLRRIEIRLLVRVLAIAQGLLQVVFQEKFLRQAGLGAHITRNHRIVLGRMRVSLGRERQARLRRRVAARTDLVENLFVIGRIAHHGNVAPVLGSAAQHRRTADVDVLDGVFHGHARLRDGSGERIEVDAHQVDEFNTVFLQGLQM